MKQTKIVKFIALSISLVVFFACSEQGEKTHQEKSNQKTGENDAGIKAKEAENGGMSLEEAEVLDMMKTAYEQNAEDLINWSTEATKANNVEQANKALLEYIEVQKRFNNSLAEIGDQTANKLGVDYVYSLEYETAFQAYLSDPLRTQRSKKAATSFMRLVNLYGDDATFIGILKELEEMNKHKMKQ